MNLFLLLGSERVVLDYFTRSIQETRDDWLSIYASPVWYFEKCFFQNMLYGLISLEEYASLL